MSDDANDLTLDPCNCCDGVSIDTPQEITNLPGLPAIRYRAGTHSTFKSSMLARLATAELAPDPLLGPPVLPAPAPDLRGGDDFQAALIDAFAMAADVLTFYQERIANESYLRTATERRSILELAREIGYELKPGVAAYAPLELIIEEPPPVPASAKLASSALMPPLRDVPIAEGTKVQSVPGPGETPQTFETVEPFTAYAEWNEIRPRLLEPNLDPWSPAWTKGTIELKAGESIAIQARGFTVPARVTQTTYDEASGLTRIDFALDSPVVFNPPDVITPPIPVEALTATKRPLEHVFVDTTLIAQPWNAADLRMAAAFQEWPLDELAETMRRRGLLKLAGQTIVQTFTVRAAPFGHNAPPYDFIANPDPHTAPVVPYVHTPSEFDGMNLWGLGGSLPRIFLDGIYKDIAAPGLALLWKGAAGTDLELREIANVTSVSELTRKARSMTAKVTTLGVGATQAKLELFPVRNTAILAGSIAHDATTKPIATIIRDAGPFQLDGVFLRLLIGQKIVVAGERDDARGVLVREVGTLKEVKIDGPFTTIKLDANLAYTYVRSSVTFCANVADSTHGETVGEVLGNGDASLAYQSFTLRQTPLTYVASENAAGVASTLQVTVNDVIWSEVPTLYGRGPRERIYVTQRRDDGRVTVQFGDGLTGARLPTGQGNIRAQYRKGTGLDGLVGPDKLTLLMARPLGLKSITNPIAASDAADPEPRDEARANAPLTVLTMDRVVSLRDFEDFVRGRPGVAKALASWMLGTERRGVFVTVAGPNGKPIANTGSIETSLRTSGNRFVPVKVRTFRQLFFRIAATVKVEPDRLPDVVKAAIETKLRDTFSFASRAFGQPVHSSEVIALIQSVPGVLSVNLTKLETDLQHTAPLTAAVPEGDLAAANAGAELLLLDPRPVALTVTT
ncbi:MAG: hypothetical protein JWO56_1822 [Acidobacteria bacterium]|nr:hypothetical protein [Acidobacteriota bacterium]